MGNITSDIEVRKTNSGTSVCSVGFATNRRYLQNEEWKEEVQFHNLVFWANKAEQIGERCKKGTRLYIEGRLQTRSWESDGVKRYKTEVVVIRFILIDRFIEKDKGVQAPQQTGDNNNASISTTEGTKTPAKKEEKIDPDDLPF